MLIACVRVKGGENDCLYMNAVIKEVKMGMGRSGVRFLEEERE